MNSKGFRYQTPHIGQGEALRLGRICDAVLSGEEPDAPKQLASWMSRITRKLGGEKAWSDWFIYSLNDDLGYAIATKFHEAVYKLMPVDVKQEVSNKAMECMTSSFLSAGFILGQDFSVGSDGCLLLGDAVIAKLKATMPPDAWQYWTAHNLIQPVTSCPWDALEKRLAIPFRQNLLNRLSELVEQSQPPQTVAGWMFVVGCSVSAHVVGNHDDLYLIATMTAHLKQTHPQEWVAIKQCFDATDVVDCDLLLDMDINCLFDVAIAAGSSESNGEIKGDYISRKGLERLSLVWRGDTFSVPELIGHFDQFTNKNAA
jgi:hypothetical protein